MWRKSILLFTFFVLLASVCYGQEAATDESRPLFPVRENGKWGYIDRTAKIVISPQFDWALAFSRGLARVGIGDKWGYIDKTGKYIWEPTE